MASVDDFVNAIQQNLVNPLQHMPLAQIRQLDGLHDQSVMDFQNAIGKLYAPPGPFVGKTADNVADLVGRFLSTEGQISQYDSGGHSQRMDQLVQICQQVVADLKPLLNTLHNSPPLSAAGATLLTGEKIVNTTTVPGPEDPAWDIGQLIILLIGGTVFMVADDYQKFQMLQAWHRVTQWQDDMTHLGQQPEPALPPDPSQPVASAALADATFIVNSVPQVVRDIRRILKDEGIRVTDKEVWDLLNQGLTAKEVLDLLRKRAQLSKYLQGQNISNYNKEELSGWLLRGFTFKQIAAILEARAYLINPKGLAPYTQAQIETYARTGLSGQDIIDALLLGIPPTEPPAVIKQQLANARSRIVGPDGKLVDLGTVRSHERRVILLLASEGYNVTIIPEGGNERKSDVIIQGIGKVELKYLNVQPGDHQQQLMKQIDKSISGTPQADHMIIDGQDNGITKLQAEDAVREMAKRLKDKHVKWVRIIGSDYDITISIPDLTVSTNP
ncbi:MAG: hypothetical protein H0W02_04650 [Ktedonobacteraceae bacterium]|nr:hypothetical protein [Ktedonobacteraceae bacterium]